MNVKNVSMKDIAQKLDLSINAVSLSLNNKNGVSDKTRQKVLKLADELGYFEYNKKYVKTLANNNFCLLISNLFINDQNFYAKIILEISQVAQRNRFDIIVVFYDKTDTTLPNCIEMNKVSGVIVLGNTPSVLLDLLDTKKIPVVLVDTYSYSHNFDCIVSANKYGSYIATKFLINNHITKIGFFGDLTYSVSINERYDGYVQALKESIDYLNIELELTTYINTYSVLDEIEHYILTNNTAEIKNKILAIKKMPEAFICSNDNAALRLMRILNEIGLQVPKDVSVIGFDNIDMCEHITPKLTSLNVDKKIIAKKSIDKLIQKINNKKYVY